MTEARIVGNASIKAAFRFYLDHQAELVAKYDGKVIAIKDGRILGAYDDHLQALRATSREHDPGTFLLQLVSEGTEAYTATFRSRVAAPAE